METWLTSHYAVLKDFASPAVTLLGFITTTTLAIIGFKTFEKWKREKLEERRIETAIEALSIAYESKYVFDSIRSPLSFEYEWKEMAAEPGETEGQQRTRGSFYAIARRVQQNKDFFERAFKLQPRCMAMFGAQAEDIFMLMHKARREIEVAAQTLAWKVGQSEGFELEHNAEFYAQCRRDIWDTGEFEPEKDKVGIKLKDFRTKMECQFRPVIDQNFKAFS